VTITNAKSTVTSTNLTGDLTVTQNTGAVTLGTVSGTVTLGDTKANATIGSAGAVVATGNDQTQNITITTLGSAADSSISNFKDVTVNGNINTGTNDLTISTIAGDVNLKGTTTVDDLVISGVTGDVNLTGNVNAATSANITSITNLNAGANTIDTKVLSISASGNVTVDTLNGQGLATSTASIFTTPTSNVTINTTNTKTTVSNTNNVTINDANKAVELYSVTKADLLDISGAVASVKAGEAAKAVIASGDTLNIGAGEVGATYDVGNGSIVGASVNNLTIHAASMKATPLTATVISVGAMLTATGPLKVSFTQPNVQIEGNLNFKTDVEFATTNNFTFDSIKGSPTQHSAVAQTSDITVAGTISGTNAALWQLMKAKSSAAFAFEATDATVVNEFTLVGKYDDIAQSGTFNHTYVDSTGVTQTEVVPYSQVFTAGAINNTTGSDSTVVEGTTDNGVLKVRYSVSGGNVVHEILSNNYIETHVATNPNEAEYARVLDNIKHTGSLDKDSELIRDVKMPYITGAKSLSGALPNAMGFSARQQLNLANSVMFTNLEYLGMMRSMLSVPVALTTSQYVRPDYAHDGSEKGYEGVTSVSIRSINRMGTFSGTDGNSDASSYSAGGLANVDYIVNNDLFCGLSFGGSYSRANGDNGAGHVESTNFIVNAYVDYLLRDGLDFYFGMTYSYGDNTSFREASLGEARCDYESGLLGIFGGLRYTMQIPNTPITITPMIGATFASLFTDSAREKDYTGADAMEYNGADYQSLRTIVGAEFAYYLEDVVRFSLNAMYLHECLDNRYDVGYSLNPSLFGANTGTVRGSKLGRDYAVLGCGASGYVSDEVAIGANYNAEVSRNELNHYIGAYVKFEF